MINSRSNSDTKRSTVCVGHGKAGELADLLTNQLTGNGVREARKDIFGELTMIGDSVYLTDGTSGLLTTQDTSKVLSGILHKLSFFGKGEHHFTVKQDAGTQKRGFRSLTLEKQYETDGEIHFKLNIL